MDRGKIGETDADIAQAATLLPIVDIGRERLGIEAQHPQPFGHTKAKIGLPVIRSLENRSDGTLILVTVFRHEWRSRRRRLRPGGADDRHNLHFTGDFHAITSATNLLAALVENHIHWGNPLGIDPRRVNWRRALDMNDRAVRQIVSSLGGVSNAYPREDGFDITVATEVIGNHLPAA